MLPSVTMSRPAFSCSLITAATASVYASSCCTSLNATRTSRPSSWCLNQCGRGYEPTIVVGRRVSTIFGAMNPRVWRVVVGYGGSDRSPRFYRTVELRLPWPRGNGGDGGNGFHRRNGATEAYGVCSCGRAITAL